MGSVTLSGFNNIDFSVVINAIMEQERQPVAALESQQTALQRQKTAFGTLASKLATLQSAAQDVAADNAFQATSASTSDSSRITVSADGTASVGTYQVYVDKIALAQVSTSDQEFADKDTTVVSGAGTLRITGPDGDVDIAVSGDVTLQGLANAINADSNSPVSASIIRNTNGKYQLMLTGHDTGEENAFAVSTANLTGGGNTLTFGAVQSARDAQIRFNGVTATSATNTFGGVINGVSLSVLKEDVENPVTVTISANFESVVNLVQKLVAAFNDLTSYIEAQTSAAAASDTNSIGRDPLVRGLRSQLARVITADHTNAGSYSALAEVGFEFSRTGQLQINDATLREALADHKLDLKSLFRGADGSGGAFGTLDSTIEEYTKAGGLVPNTRDRITTQLSQLSDRIADMEERLAIRRSALQKEYAAADAAIAQLNSQSGSLSSLGSQYKLF